MNKQLIIVGIVVLLVTVGLSGCNQTNNQATNSLNAEKNKFVGTWTELVNGVNLTEIYFSDGTFIQTYVLDGSGTYDIKDGKLILTYGNGNSIARSYSFSDNDKTLTVIDVGVNPLTMVFTKQ